jgi:hypothetical protein
MSRRVDAMDMLQRAMNGSALVGGMYGSALEGGKFGVPPVNPAEMKRAAPGGPKSMEEKIATQTKKGKTVEEAKNIIDSAERSKARAKSRKAAQQKALYEARLAKYEQTSNPSLKMADVQRIRAAAKASWELANPSSRTKLTPQQKEAISKDPSYIQAKRGFSAASKALAAARKTALGRR